MRLSTKSMRVGSRARRGDSASEMGLWGGMVDWLAGLGAKASAIAFDEPSNPPGRLIPQFHQEGSWWPGPGCAYTWEPATDAPSIPSP